MRTGQLNERTPIYVLHCNGSISRSVDLILASGCHGGRFGNYADPTVARPVFVAARLSQEGIFDSGHDRRRARMIVPKELLTPKRSTMSSESVKDEGFGFARRLDTFALVTSSIAPMSLAGCLRFARTFSKR